MTNETLLKTSITFKPGGPNLPVVYPRLVKNAIVVLLAASSAWGQPSQPPSSRLSLRETIRMAQARQVEVIVAEKRVLQALDRLSQTRSPLLPQVDGSASQFRRTDNLKAQGIPLPINPLIGPYDTFDARVRLTQTLFDLSTINRLKSARKSYELSVAERDKAQQDAMALVATLFLDAQRADQAIVLAETFVRRDQLQADLAHKQLDIGLGSSIDAAQADAVLSASSATLKDDVAAAAERHLDLVAALGIPSAQKIELVPELDEVSWGPFNDGELENLAQGSSDVQVARKNLEVSVAEETVAKSAFLPKVSASVDYGSSGNTPSGALGTYSFGAQIAVPLYTGGLWRSKVKETRHISEELKARLDDSLLHAETQAKSANESLKGATAQMQARHVDLDVADRQLTLAQHRLELGLGSRLEVIQSEAQKATAADRYWDALSLYRTAQINLAHALAGMEKLGGLGKQG